MPSKYKLYDNDEVIKNCCEKETISIYATLKGGKKFSKKVDGKLKQLKELHDTTICDSLKIELISKEI